MVIFLNYCKAYDVIKMATLHRTLCDVVWRHKDVSTDPHCITRENWLYTTILISFVVQYVCFLVLYQTCPCIGSSGSQCGLFKTDCDFKMSEISNIACRWVKTMPELLKPRPLHVHGNFVFSVCKL